MIRGLAIACAVLADMAHHPDARVVIAARIVTTHSRNNAERKEAHDLRQLIEGRSSDAASPQGGAA
ncbi:hypothetical protein PAF17_18525 [Paracoccus sp. Z330]|uniref:Uncharacterized protein n=1 Tax=Paracoccus onchidii TaxID=3017813 RepID=A0ABT4ZJG6_9RHOB|nr:hypothetical protein [Paracoccus onchidii]MDB6179481.1 hypothetical protein [Paracoccus onchidii]